MLLLLDLSEEMAAQRSRVGSGGSLRGFSHVTDSRSVTIRTGVDAHF